MPAGNGEGLQVLRYQKEQKYDGEPPRRAAFYASAACLAGAASMLCLACSLRCTGKNVPDLRLDGALGTLVLDVYTRADTRAPLCHSAGTRAAHWDYFFHKEGTTNGGNRYATVLMYLVDTEEGGETVFPK